MAFMYPCDLHTCEHCIWAEQCGEDGICEHFSPADDCLDFIYYENDLRMRAAEYEEVVTEYGDVDWKMD